MYDDALAKGAVSSSPTLLIEDLSDPEQERLLSCQSVLRKIEGVWPRSPNTSLRASLLADASLLVHQLAAYAHQRDMVAMPTLEAIEESLIQSGLISAETLASLTSDQQISDTTALAFELVRRGVLNRHQAHLLCTGEVRQLLLGDYLILEKIGRGGMGAVYKARHQRLSKLVALKILTDFGKRGLTSTRRFEREILAAGSLQHRNIVQANDARLEDGTFFLVMEFVEGMDLSRLLAGVGPLPIPIAAEIIRQAAGGLGAIHACGMIHRDVKPSNLMLDSEGNVKILDLGLAMFERVSVKGDLTQSGQLMGTADYMAPEQTLDPRAVDHRADIYSLGCTFYALIAGHAPFETEAFDTPGKKLIAHVNEKITPLGKLRPEVTKELSRLVSSMVQSLPENRIVSAQLVVNTLEPFCRGVLLSEYVATIRNGPFPGWPTTEDAAHVDTQSFTALDPTPELGTSVPHTSHLRRLAKKKTTTPRAIRYVALGLGACLLGVLAIGLFRGTRIDSSNEATARAGDSLRSAQTGLWASRPTDNQWPGLIKQPAKLPGIGRWQVDTVAPSMGHVHFMACRISPDSQYVAVTSDLSVKVYTLPSLKLVSIFKGHTGRIRSLAWSESGQWIVSGAADKTARVWNVQEKKPVCTFTRHGMTVQSLAWDNKNNHILSGEFWGNDLIFTYCWKVNGDIVWESQHPGCVESICWPTTGKNYYTSGYAKYVCVWQKANGNAVSRFEAEDVITKIKLSPDDKYLLVGSGFNKPPYTIALLETEGLTVAKKWTSTNKVESFAWSPDSKSFVATNDDGQVVLYRLDDVATKVVLEHAGLGADVDWSQDGNWIVSLGHDKILREYWVVSDIEQRSLSCEPPDVVYDEENNCKVSLANGAVAEFSSWGELITNNVDAINDELVYVLENDDGTMDLLKPSAFAAKIPEWEAKVHN